MRLWRAHGLGNDYLVLEEGPALDAHLARALCHRHLGVGSDGVLEPVAGEGADFGVRIWNPDGSVAEKSGNGLRILATWLHEQRGAPQVFTVSTGAVSTGGEVVRCHMRPDGVSVDMGRAVVESVDELVGELSVAVVHTGNPHCVVFVEEALDSLPWRSWGRTLEVHPRFPARTNVQVARIVGPREVEIRIWERGAGETMASGSSSCATAAAAVRTGRLEPGQITVRMPGGALLVEVSQDYDLVLTGPVEVVGRFEVDPRWLQARA